MPEPKRKRGRPATGQTKKRYFRMDDKSYAKVTQAADEREQSVSDFIRDALLKAVASKVEKKGAEAP